MSQFPPQSPPPPPPPPPSSSSSRSVRTPTPAEIVVMSGAGVAFVFSFLAFYDSSFSSESINAWGSHLFPVSTLIALFAVVAGAFVALRLFGVNIPESLVSYTWKQVVLACGFFATLLALAFLLQDRGGGVDLGIGYWFMLFGSIAVLVGAVMLTRESAN